MHHNARETGEVITYGLLLIGLGGALSAGLLLRLSLLEKSLGDQDVVVSRDGTMINRSVRSPAYHAVWNTERRCENCCYYAAFSAWLTRKMFLIGETRGSSTTASRNPPLLAHPTKPRTKTVQEDGVEDR